MPLKAEEKDESTVVKRIVRLLLALFSSCGGCFSEHFCDAVVSWLQAQQKIEVKSREKSEASAPPAKRSLSACVGKRSAPANVDALLSEADRLAAAARKERHSKRRGARRFTYCFSH